MSDIEKTSEKEIPKEETSEKEIPKEETPKKGTPKKGTPKKKTPENNYLEIMNTLNTDVLYLNHKKEVFTQKNLAELSVTDKSKVKELKREILEIK